MSLKNKRRLLYGLLVLTLALTVLVGIVGEAWIAPTMILAGISLAALVVCCIALWRCPYCHKYLGRIDDCEEFCKHCGKKLDL